MFVGIVDQNAGMLLSIHMGQSMHSSGAKAPLGIQPKDHDPREPPLLQLHLRGDRKYNRDEVSTVYAKRLGGLQLLQLLAPSSYWQNGLRRDLASLMECIGSMYLSWVMTVTSKTVYA